MSRRGFAKPPAGNHIFPFLAVLICTMGALVTLLVVISSRARTTAVAAAMAEARGQAEHASSGEREDLAWRIDQLRAVRDRNEQSLAEQRQKLSHVEDHLRRLRAEMRRLEQETIGAKRSRQSAASATDDAELARLERELDVARRELAAAEEAARGRQPKYAVVPYQGPNQTRRRPIYLECRADRVVLQPEGVELLDADFEGPMGPGNPLAATLRSVCEQVGQDVSADGAGSVPYPLLLVRPDGIPAYYAARAALNSWGSEFGYEFIESDWELDFPPADAQVKQFAETTLVEARERQQRLIAAAPRQYAKPNRALYTANGRGGLRQFSGPSGTPGGPRSEPGGLGQTHREGFVSGPNGASGTVSVGKPGGTARRGSRGFSGGAPGGAPGAGPKGDGEPLISGGATALADEGHPAESDVQGTAVAGAAFHPAESSGEGVASALARGGAVGDAGSVPMGVPGDSLIGAAGAPQHGDAESSAQASGRETRGAASAAKDKRRYTASPGGGIASLASTRGRGWGLPEAGAESSPVARPIRVLCQADRLVLIADESAAAQREVVLPGATDESVDELVSSVWQSMKSWGTAGRGLYWKPVLVFEVAPGAQQRYAELQALLSESGLEVRERQTQASSAARSRRR